MTTVKNTPMDPRTRAELEERVRIGRAAQEALDKLEKKAQVTEDPRVGREFYIKFICREVQPNGWARVESQDGDIYEFLEGLLIAVDTKSAIAAWNARAGAPAIDAGEVERLANALMYIPVHDSDGRYAARAALLAYVTKGVDVGELVEACRAFMAYVKSGAVDIFEYDHLLKQPETVAMVDRLAAVTAAKGGR